MLNVMDECFWGTDFCVFGLRNMKLIHHMLAYVLLRVAFIISIEYVKREKQTTEIGFRTLPQYQNL